MERFDRAWTQDEVKNRGLPIHFTSTDMIYRILNHVAVVPLSYMKYVKPRDKGRGKEVFMR